MHRCRFVVIAAALALAASGASPVNAASTSIDVTQTPIVQADLQLAYRYWGVSPPSPMSVVVMDMVPGQSNGGTATAAGNLAMETYIGGYTIFVSPATWQARSSDGGFFCLAIAHEYGHTLGYPDSASQPLMNYQASKDHDPLCRAPGLLERQGLAPTDVSATPPATEAAHPSPARALAPPARTYVTANPTVRHDLALAARFWHFERPGLAASCAPEQVVLTSMSNGVGNDGVEVSSNDAWAQTRLGRCEIDISHAAWREIAHAPTIGGRYGVCTIVWRGSTGTCSTNGYSQLDVCIRIAHEYAHTLGLGDTANGPPILNQTATGGDPVCSLAYDPHHLSRSDKEWLRAHGIFHFGGRPASRPSSSRTAG